jgi:DNA-binding response OmpR family regulator
MPGRIGTVLIAQDNEIERCLIEKAFLEAARPGSTLHFVRDARELIDYLMACARPPILIVLDTNLPRLGARSSLKWLKQNELSSVPVVIISDEGAPADHVMALAVGALLKKPRDFKGMKALVENLKKYSVGAPRTAANADAQCALAQKPSTVHESVEG